MASKINASTAGIGGIETIADNTGQLELQTAQTTRVTITPAGSVGIGTVPNDSSHLEIAAGTTTKAPLEFDPGVLMTTPDDGSFEYDGKLFYACPLDARRGILPSEHFYRLNSTVVGANATGAQNIFGVGITLAASTQYEFEMIYSLVKTAGTTSHTISLLFGGTATLNNISYISTLETDASATNVTGTGAVMQFISAATATVATAAQTAASLSAYGFIRGTVSINAGGTFIPQYSLSAAPGGAYTTQIGSYIKIKPIGAAGATINVGGFA